MIGLSYPHMIIDFWTRGKMMLLKLAPDCGSGHEQPRNNPKVRAADHPGLARLLFIRAFLGKDVRITSTWNC
jgi:hypothetical protein